MGVNTAAIAILAKSVGWTMTDNDKAKVALWALGHCTHFMYIKPRTYKPVTEENTIAAYFQRPPRRVHRIAERNHRATKALELTGPEEVVLGISNAKNVEKCT